MVDARNTDLTSVNIGEIVDCTVEQIMPYGAFVRITKAGRKGMIHISELSYNFVKDINEFLHVQDNIKAKVIKIDDKGRIDLSIKRTTEPPQRKTPESGPRDFHGNTQRDNSGSGFRSSYSNAFNANREARPPREQHYSRERERESITPREIKTEHMPAAGNFTSLASSSSSPANEKADFEQKMASFLKTSEAKITDLNSRSSSRSGRSRRNGRQDKREY